MLNDIVTAIEAAGGEVFFVGGYVRDTLLGRVPKDIDMEVFGVPEERLVEVLKPFGTGTVKQVGKAFAIVKLRTSNGNEFDFNLPRRERKIGVGYKEFEIEVDVNMPKKEACSRRGCTIEAMMMDFHTGLVLDFFGGIEDLKNRTLRATTERFEEEPIRVLRLVRFAARLGFTVERNTIEMAKRLRSEFHTIDRDRIMMEFLKMADEAWRPSMGFEVLWQTQWYRCFPQLAKFVRDEPGFFFSNVSALDKIVQYCDENQITGEDRRVMFFTTLVRGYHGDGIQLLTELYVPSAILERVRPMLTINMPSEVDAASVRYLANHLHGANRPHPLATVAMFLAVRRAQTKASNFAEVEQIAREQHVLTGKIPPILNGDHLKELGYQPGKQFGDILRNAYDNQMNGGFTDLNGAKQWLASNQPL